MVMVTVMVVIKKEHEKSYLHQVAEDEGLDPCESCVHREALPPTSPPEEHKSS